MAERESAGRVWVAVRRFLSRISFRLLAFNVLLVFLPVAGLFYLDVYEAQLRRSQERSMVQQGRLLAAALTAGEDALDAERGRAILEGLQLRTSARLRVLDRDGNLLADSSLLGPRANGSPAPEETPGTEETWLYRLGALPFRLWDRVRPPARGADATDFYASDRPFDGPEVRDALAGRYGATTRLSPAGQRSVTFYIAIPIRIDGGVVGAVLVSQSTYQILQDLYEVRLQIFKVFLASMAVAAVLSLLLSTTIARPLDRLRRETQALLDGRGRLTGRFEPSTRLDEIGDLTRALRGLAKRLREHLAYLESFAGDLSHELKNPLASIRSATEVLAEVDDPEERRHFLDMVEGDIARMEHLLSTLREVTLIDSRLEMEERHPVVLDRLLSELCEGWRRRAREDVGIRLKLPERKVEVVASAERLAQVFENLLDNAVSYTPPGAEIVVSLDQDGEEAVITVGDAGGGIPEEHLEQIFHRFFSYRPDTDRGEHTGLGLAIVKAIVEGYGGSVTATNRSQGGALFEVRLTTRPDLGLGEGVAAEERKETQPTPASPRAPTTAGSSGGLSGQT